MENEVMIPCDLIENCTHLRIKVDYEKGSEWGRIRRRRGYYMDIDPVRIEPNFICTDSDLLQKSKVYFLEPTERKSARRLQEYITKMKNHAQEIASAFLAGQFDAVWQYV